MANQNYTGSDSKSPENGDSGSNSDQISAVPVIGQPCARSQAPLRMSPDNTWSSKRRPSRPGQSHKQLDRTVLLGSHSILLVYVTSILSRIF